MRRVVLVLFLALAGCQNQGNYVYPPGQGAGTAGGARSHQKTPAPKSGDSVSAAKVVDVNI